MNYVEKVLDGVHYVFNINPATLSGAIDIIVVPQKDGSLLSSPFHVRFGKLQLISSSEKIVSFYVNEELSNIAMKLGRAGEAYFLEETEEPVSPSLVTSPIGSPPTTRKMELDEPEEIQTLTTKLEQLSAKEQNIKSNDGKSTGASSKHEKNQIISEVPSIAVTPSVPIASNSNSQPVSSSKPIPIKSPDQSLMSPIESPVGSPQYKTFEEPSGEWNWGSLPNYHPSPSDSKAEIEEKSIENSNQTLDVEPGKEIDKKSGKSWGSKMISMFRIFKGSSERQKLNTSIGDSEDDFTREISKEITKENIPENEEKINNHVIVDDLGQWMEQSEALSKDTPNQTPLSSPINSPRNPDSSTTIFKQEIIEAKVPNIEEIPKAPKPVEEIIADPEIPPSEKAIDLRSETDLSLDELMIEMSACGHLLAPMMGDPNSNITEYINHIFKEHMITYDAFCKNPDLIFDPNVLFRIRDKIYPWAVAGPLVVSLMIFHKPLHYTVLEKLEQRYVEQMKSSMEKKGWSGRWWWRGSKSQKNNTKGEAKKKSHFRKSLRPSSDQLKSLNLKVGANSIRFVVSSALQGTREIRAQIYLMEPNSKIIISDIDGTITKSDVFGQVLPLVGKDWSHSGVAQLYSNIKANGYQFIYLTARPIGQASLTRGYITNLKQGQIQLPQGPVLMSPNRLLSAFNQEVILRKPEDFKIPCLKDLLSLFPPDSQPFYAGFGNRPSDGLSYRAVGVPLGKIFTINYVGEISIVNFTYKKTFSTLNELVHAMFPPLNTEGGTSEEFNQWNYWKTPIVNIDDDLKSAPKEKEKEKSNANPSLKTSQK